MVRFRMRTIAAGVWLTAATVAAYVVYAAMTWDRPHRDVSVAVAVLIAALSLVLLVLPMERVVRSRWREPFFLAWSTADIGAISLIASLDEGVDSALCYALVIPLAFASLSYPMRSMVGLGTLVLAGYAAIVASTGDVDASQAVFVSLVLLFTGWICAWQAKNHDQLHEELARVSRADPLTGCLNRRGFEERLAAELSRAQRSARPLGLVLLDLDGFKEVNDTRGHAAGDALLRWVAATIERTVRPADAYGRVGGDEFAVVLPDAGRAEAVDVATRLREALAEQAPGSMGVASYPADGATAEELHHHADTELYAVKRGRRDARAAQGPAELSWAAAIARAVDVRIAAQHDHSEAVGALAALVGRRLGMGDELVGRLRLAGMLHDVGKAAIPDAILRKPGPLTDEERAVVRGHPATGAELVGRVDGLATVAEWIRAAHENLDGTGYPAGLRGEQIPLGARIVHVADAYDAMTSDRPYRRAMPHADAIAELRAHAGTQFDPECVEQLVAAVAERDRAVSDA